MKNSLILVLIRILTFDYFVIKKNLRNWLPGGKIKVLDIGCGLGYFAKLFNKNRYLGIDTDLVSISIAKKTYPGYTFRVGDATNFRSKTKFDLVLVIGVLHHLSDKQMSQSINVVKNNIKKNGRVIIIEAIPPISNLNFLGKIIRSIDQGHYIRRIKDYETAINKKLNIVYSSEKPGGIVDYAVIVANNKNN